MLRFAGAYSVRGELHYGLDDRQFKHAVALAGQWRGASVSIGAFDELRAAGDAAESSLLANSISAQEIGVDESDDFRVAGVALVASGGTRLRWRATVERSRETPVSTHATPFSGTFRPAFAADDNAGTRAELRASVSRADGPLGATWDLASSVVVRAIDAPASGARAFATRFARAQATIGAERALCRGTFVGRVIAASVFGSAVPGQAGVLFGGTVTAPGYDTHSLRGSAGVTTRLEWRARVASFPLSLGRFGSTRVPIVAAPFVQGAWIRDAAPASPRPVWFRTIGLGVVSFHDLIRLDLVRALDAGGRWAIRADFGQGFWPIL